MPGKKFPTSQERLAGAIEKTPIGRLCTAEEVAWAAQFLCSDASSGIVGHTLVVDGGARIVDDLRSYCKDGDCSFFFLMLIDADSVRPDCQSEISLFLDFCRAV